MLTTADKTAKHATAARILSLALGVTAFGLIALLPETRTDDADWISRIALAAALVGAAGAVGHGFGLMPRRDFLRRLFAPGIAWPLLAAGLAVLAFA